MIHSSELMFPSIKIRFDMCVNPFGMINYK